MEFKWIVEESLWVTDSDFENICNVAQVFIRKGYKRKEAIAAAVMDYLSGYSYDAFYGITKEAISQIENEVNKRFT